MCWLTWLWRLMRFPELAAASQTLRRTDSGQIFNASISRPEQTCRSVLVWCLVIKKPKYGSTLNCAGSRPKMRWLSSCTWEKEEENYMYKYFSSSDSDKRKFPPTHGVPGFFFLLGSSERSMNPPTFGGAMCSSLPIQTLILSTRTLTDIPRAMFGQMSGNLVVQSKHNH